MIGRPELGTLSVGAEADVAVFKLLEGEFGFIDCGKATPEQGTEARMRA